jgi:ubiquinone/menaquinone biosynthesis C-methylase UbiE
MQTPATQTDFHRLTQRYTGATAQQYDERRAGTIKWQTEQEIVERLLSRLPAGASLLDIPVGTGRFLTLYRRFGIVATGMDVSADMLARAREKDPEVQLHVGDIRHVGAGNCEYDCVLCVRFLNWVDGDGLRRAVRELARVSRRHIILGVRHYAPSTTLTLRRRLRQQWVRWQPKTVGQLVIHEHALVHEAFRQAGLVVQSASPVEQSPDGTDYHIFHLTTSA